MRASHHAFTMFVVALPCLAPAATAQTCDAYFTASQSLSSVMTEAYASMSPKDPAKMAVVLPKLEAAFNKLSATEIKTEVCNGNHINAYTTFQFAELATLRAHGVDTGFPADLPLVKQPDLNQAALAYSVGWIRYEQENFDGALAAYSKGLAMFPHDSGLQQEYMATLLQLKRYDDVVAFTEKLIAGPHILNDEALGKTYAARGVALLGQNDLKGADDNFTVSLRYNNTEETKSMQAQVQTAMAANKN